MTLTLARRCGSTGGNTLRSRSGTSGSPLESIAGKVVFKPGDLLASRGGPYFSGAFELLVSGRVSDFLVPGKHLKQIWIHMDGLGIGNCCIHEKDWFAWGCCVALRAVFDGGYEFILDLTIITMVQSRSVSSWRVCQICQPDFTQKTSSSEGPNDWFHVQDRSSCETSVHPFPFC